MRLFSIAALVCVAIATATPARAEHMTAPPTEGEAPAPSSMTTAGSLDIDLKLGLDGFRVGSRVFGRDGYAGGAWLNGQTRRDGFTVDGRLERQGKAWNFRMNADVDAWVRRAARWWGLIDL